MKNKLIKIALTLVAFLSFDIISVNAATFNINSNEDYLELVGRTDPFGEDSTIVLNTDVTVDDNSRDNFYVKHNVILDLNGHTITLDWASIEVWFYTSGKTFTIIDSGATKGKIVKVAGNNYAISVWQYNSITPYITNNSLILDGITYINETTHNSYDQNIHSSITPSEDQTINIVIKNSDFTLNGNLVSVYYMEDEATRDYWNIEIENTTITQIDSDVLMGIAYEYSGDVLKYKDFIDVNKSAVYLDNVLANNEDYIEYDRNINVIEIRNIPRFEVIAPTFADASEDYGAVGSQNITINALIDNRSIKSVEVSGSNFIVDGPFGSKDVVVGTPNTSYTIKPKDNLPMGSHTSTITVTDTTNKTYTAEVVFDVNTYASTQIVMNAADLKKFISNNNQLYPEVTKVKLGANISVAGPLDIYPLNNKTLDLNGYTLSSDSYINIYFGTDSNFSNYNKYKDAVFNIIDTSAGSGAITSTFNSNHHLFKVFQYNSGTDVCNFTLNVNGGTYNYTSAESGIFNFYMDANWSNNANNRFDFNINNAAFNLNLSRDVIKLIDVWDITNKTKFHMSLSNTTVNLRGLYSALMQDQVEYTVDEIIPSTQRIVFPKDDNGLSTDEMVIADRNTLASDIRMSMPKSEIASYQIRIEAIEGFEVVAPEFDNATENYASIAAKPISITALGGNRTIKNVSVSGSEFTVDGPEVDTLVNNNTENTSFTIKPIDGLEYGLHTATITVTDTTDKTYTAEVEFNVNTYASTQIVMSASDLTKFLGPNSERYDEVTTVKLGSNISLTNLLHIYPLSGRALDLNGYTLSTSSTFQITYGCDNSANKYYNSTFNLVDTSGGKSGAIISTADDGWRMFTIDELNDDSEDVNYTFNLNGGTYSATSSPVPMFEFDVWDNSWDSTDRFNYNISNATFNLNLNTNTKLIEINESGFGSKDTININLSDITVNLNSGSGLISQTYYFELTVDDVIPGTHRIAYPDIVDGVVVGTKYADRSMTIDRVYLGSITDPAPSYQIKVERIEGFEVIAPTFDSRVFGYADEDAKAITIKTVGPTRTVKSVVVSDNTLFTPSGVGPVEIASNALDNTTFTIKPNHGLGAGTHSATITVTDSLDNTYTAQVSFVVNKANITPSVDITSWEYGDTPNSPVVNGNTGAGTESFFYVGTGSTSYYSNVRPTDVGTYKVVAIIGATDNYNSAECENAFEITKKIVDVTDSKIYFRNKLFDKNSSPLYTIEEGAVDVSSDYFDVDFEITNSSTTSNEMVGEYDGKVILTISPHVSPYYMFSNGTDTYEIVSSYEIKAAPVTILDTTNDSAEIVRGTTLDLDDIIDINYTLKNVDNFEAINGLKDLLTYEIDDSYTGSEITLSGSVLTASNTASIGDTVKINVSFPGYNYDSNGSLEFSSSLLSVYVEVVNKPSQTINITNNTVNLTYGNVYSNPITSSDNAATITYSSSDSTVVEVNTTTGELTAKKYSATPVTITVNASETSTHSATSNTYTVNVAKASLEISAGTYKVSKEYDAKTIPGMGSGNLVVNGVKFNDNLDTAILNVVATPRIYASANITPANTNGYVDIAITGTASENYTLTNNTVLVPYEITPAVITLDVSLTPDCIYSGSTCVPTTVVVTNQADSSTISSDDYTFAIDADADTINVGEVWFTITAKPGLNYTWEPHRQYYIIYKAPAPTFADLNRSVLENKAETYSIDYSAISLPGLKNPVIEAVEYDGELISTASLDDVNSRISYTVLSKAKDTTGTLTLTISSDNHENSTIDIVITAVAKTLVVISGYTISDKNYDGNRINVSGTLNATEGYDVSNISCVYTGSNSYNSSVAPTNAGNYSLTCSIPESDANYMGEATWTFNINKVNPTYNMPSDLVGTIGNKLSSITLPDGFSWEAPTTDLVAGAHEYDATFTPEDEINYNVITGIDVNVYTKSKYNVTTSVEGGNGSITPTENDIVEGTTKEITFTPNTGFMINKVLVNDVDKTNTVTGNKITLTVNDTTTVKVSYKKIPLSFTVNATTGATVLPAELVGTTGITYGDTKVLTITADFGYRLTSIKVNGVESLAELSTDNKLTLDDITDNTTVVVTAEKIVYEVLEGANLKTKETSKLRFKFDADYSKFETDGEVYIDDTLVDATNYTSEEGSTIITLNDAFAQTLDKKKHTIRIVFNDGGEATTNFTIIDPTANPHTGDNILIYVIVLIVSLLGISTLAFIGKKKLNAQK